MTYQHPSASPTNLKMTLCRDFCNRQWRRDVKIRSDNEFWRRLLLGSSRTTTNKMGESEMENTIKTSSRMLGDVFEPCSEEAKARNSDQFSYSLSTLQFFIGIFFVFRSLLLSHYFIAMAKWTFDFDETGEPQFPYHFAAEFYNHIRSPIFLISWSLFSHWKIFLNFLSLSLNFFWIFSLYFDVSKLILLIFERYRLCSMISDTFRYYFQVQIASNFFS